jgi:hypothetical protein
MDPNLYKKKTAVKPFLRRNEKIFSVIPLNKKPETLRKEHPGESGFSAAARQAEGFAPANFPAAIRERPAAAGGKPSQWSSTGIRRFPPPDHSGSGFFHPETLIA